MTTPTTPTGKDLVLQGHLSEDWGIQYASKRDILAIEAEAAAQERAMLLEEHCAGHDDTDGPCETCVLLRAKR